MPATALFLGLGVDAGWWLYAAVATGAFGAGALMVAHAPLRPWREPAAAGALAIAVLAIGASDRVDWAFEGVFSRLLRPWYVGLGTAVVSGALAAAGGAAVRRLATASPRTDLILVLSSLVVTGITGLVVMVAYPSPATLLLLAGVAAGGFITQAVIAPKRPWACGAGSGFLVLFGLAREGLDQDPTELTYLLVGGIVFVLIGYGGAQLAWWLLRRGAAPTSPDVPSARLG